VAEDASREQGGGFVGAERDHRLAKLDELRKRGIEPYPVRFDRDRSVADVLGALRGVEAGRSLPDRVSVAGRLMLIRRHGGLIFADLRDRTGRIQLMVSRDEVGAEHHADFEHLDIGDWVGAEGVPAVSQRGEPSIRVARWQLLSKSLRTLPKGHGFTDPEQRFRQRYVDLVVNDDADRIFKVRSATIASIRRTFAEEGYTEVETPVLDTHAGGAAARPFITHHNALDIDMFLRIALELSLKRLIVGGMERVFEIGRVFRNEGLDTRHNPEFTLLESYGAYLDYHDMMDLVEKLCRNAAQDALGTTVVEIDGREVDLGKPFRRAPMAELIAEHAGVQMHPSMPVEEARKIADDRDVGYLDVWGSGKIMAEVYDATCEAELHEPTFVMDHPREVSPLARAHRDDPLLTERFELVVAARELANAYSELNDPLEQRARFEEEARLQAGGDEEAESVDEDYIRALEYGLPPTGGLGVGIDRLVMLLTGAASIREVILFPTMRPLEGAGDAAIVDLPTPAELRSDAAEAREGTDPVSTEGSDPHSTGSHPGAARIKGSDPARRWMLRMLALAVAIAGVISLLPSLPGVRESFGIDTLLPADERASVHVAAVLLGALLLFISLQIARGKRGAWWIALVLLTASAVAHLLKGPDPIAIAVDLAAAGALLATRRRFTAAPERRTAISAVRFAGLYLLAVVVFGCVSLLVERDHLSPDLSLGGALETTFKGLVGLDGPYTYESDLFNRFFGDALLVLGILGAAIVLWLIFRPFVLREGPSLEDRDRARGLVRDWGDDTLAYFALRRDKHYFFSSDGRAMIAFAYIRGYALVSGDPIGDPAAIPALLDEFLAECRRRGWRVAFLAVRESQSGLYESRGFDTVYLGDEAIIHCRDFSLRAKGMKAVRSAVSRVERDHSFELIRESAADRQLVDHLNRISERWRAGNEERGFTMESDREVEGLDDDLLLAIARDSRGTPVGFLRLVPSYGADPAYSLDLMRREPGSVNGLTEFLIARSAIALGHQGFDRLSMNFAAWGRLFDDGGGELGFRDRILRRAAEAANPYFQIKSLRDFNQKFGPEWLPRSIAVEDAAAMPRVGLLYASVEGFLNVPLLGRFFVPRSG
jgi:lysyl-tRNA synthetase, class II